MDGETYFGDDFGQKIDLTVRIREILRNYPEGTSVLKEMVQNADDAGATEVNFCLDYRHHPVTGLAYEKLALFQGPSLLVHNNATFSEADFQSIQRIGDSLKKTESKGWKTGRFGVGFNSVYHVTDLPVFVSGSQLVFFDPQACHLPNVNPSNPGKMIDYIAHPTFVHKFPNQMSPFQCFGCNFLDPFPGTIFRLALRTKEQALRSNLSDRAQTPAMMAEMLEEFADILPTVLLFLRNVSKILIWEWNVGENAPTARHEVMIHDMTPEIKTKRSLQYCSTDQHPTSHFSTDGVVCDYPLTINSHYCTKRMTKTYEYLIMNQLGGGTCTEIACKPSNASQRLVPWGGVAVLMNGDFANSANNGLAFCFLPLPTHTHLPVHVNGYFELSSNRRDIWFGEGLSGDGLLRAQWNIALLRDVIAPCYARAVSHLANSQILTPDRHVRLLPQEFPPAPWDSLAHAFFSLIRCVPCLFSEVGGGRWVAPADSMVIPHTHLDSKKLEQLLIQDGFPIVRNLNENLERSLIKSGTISSYVVPQTLRDAYKNKHSSHAGDRYAVRCIVDFMLSDLEPCRLNVLVGVKFLPVADGTLQMFENHLTFDSNQLDKLCSMGFARQHAAHALAITGNSGVDTALGWLLQNPISSAVLRENAKRIYSIPNYDELKLLEKARCHLVDIEAISVSGLELLSSNEVQMQLNLQPLTFQEFEAMLAVVLPASWFGKVTATWSETDDGDEPNEEWFRQLWKYIGPSRHLSLLKDTWPIVPTSSHKVAQLSSLSGVLSADLIPDGCLSSLQKLQIPVLLPNLFASFQPNPKVWQYIHQPTPVGVLSCIDVALGKKKLDEVITSFEPTDAGDRDHLLKFLMSGDISDMKADHQKVCCKLPIFRGFKSISQMEVFDAQWVSNHGDSVCEPFSYVFVSLAEIRERQQEPMICIGVAETFLDENFVFVEEGDLTLANFLSHLGARQISKVEFYAKHVIPRIVRIDRTARINLVYHMLFELPHLMAQDDEGILSRLVETAVIYPTMAGDLKSIGDLYDPEIDDFMDIMDESFFPALELQDPQPLSALRTIGLQRTLSRRSILSLAVSLENTQKKIVSGSAGQNGADVDDLCAKLRSRSVRFFQYVDSHIDQLVAPRTLRRHAYTQVKTRKKVKRIQFLRSLIGDDRSRKLDTSQDNNVPSAEELGDQAMENAEIEDFKAKLTIIEWIPVCETNPHPAAPWYQEGKRVIVASSQQSRPIKQLWLCSSQFHIIKSSVHSEVLREILGWEKRLPVQTIATQLKKISELFDSRRTQRNSSGPHSSDTHVIWPAVYNIYQMLSVFFETEQESTRREEVLTILSRSGKYVWVGDRFVSASHVATVTIVNAEPYLYSVPNELLHFRPFLKTVGVRERFALADYVYVLEAMYKDSLNVMTSNEGHTDAAPLSSDRLTTVIGLIQLISDTLQHHSDYELFAPDRNGVLHLASSLTFDDAPWLDKFSNETSLEKTRFIHSKISNDVAAKIGSRPLRNQLLSESGREDLNFGGVEAFGQTEALTKRIAHILEQYPDGPNIINELIQNADDAGATCVSILYNNCTYGTSSLLSPSMAKWQGPALYCYNDSEFTDKDFINLASIGQASKLQRATTTGRFGLGFNSVYHFTDLPSIVSAKSIVIFDPHATHLPHISAANPGMKIRFANANIVKQFPDQFAPFKNVFGCDMEHHYKGTLFRFPLRNSTLAEISQIKRRGYSHCEIVDLFKSFQGSIIDTMLFLRNVRNVNVYFQTKIDQPPVFLYGAEVPAEERRESWRKIDYFLRTDHLSETDVTTELSAKRNLYKRLRSTPTEDLPYVTQVLNIRRREHQEMILRFEEMKNQKEFKIDDDTVQMRIKDEMEEMEESIEKYLICNQIGGGKAREMACSAENESLKLIPWVGIAGRIDGVPLEGRAFCFLPLPVRNGYPVHVNGYFELSSNRRDIWTGDDMNGDGKLRSEWNAKLLTDAAAPAYLNFLLTAKAICQEDPSQYLSFFPTCLPSSPWNGVALELFRIMKNKPIFLASTSQHMNDRIMRSPSNFVAPGSCILVDDTISEWRILEDALGTASLTTVQLPVGIRNLLIQSNAVCGAMTPDYFRRLARQGNFLPGLAQNSLKRVVQFCLSDLLNSPFSSAAQALNHLPLLPLMNGKFERLCFIDGNLQNDDTDTDMDKKQRQILYFGNVIEEQLLVGFHHRLVSREFKELFDQLPTLYETSNLGVLNLDIILEQFLPQVLGRSWHKVEKNVFALASPLEPEGTQAKKDWLRLLWTYAESLLQTIEQPPQSFVKLPLVPVLCDEENRWICLSSNVSLVLPDAQVSSSVLNQLQHVLAKVDVYIVNTSYVSGERCLRWLLARKYAYKVTSDGVLAAMSRSQFQHDRHSFDDIFAATTAGERQVLCDFFARNTFDTISKDFQSVLFEIPIFPVYTNQTGDTQISSAARYVSLSRGGYLPDMDVDSAILDSSFFCAEKQTLRRFLRDCGIDEWTSTKILLDHVFPRLQVLERQDADLVDSVIVSALETLSHHQRNNSRFRDFVTSQAIIPSRKRVFREIHQLHDPSVSELSELVGDNSLPAQAFSTPSMIHILRSLGLQTGLSCQAVLESARSIEAMYSECGGELAESASLKAHSLLSIVNKHFDMMMLESNASDPVTENQENSGNRSQEIAASLKEICWLPIKLESPDPAMPWKRLVKNGNNQPILSNAAQTRPMKDAVSTVNLPWCDDLKRIICLTRRFILVKWYCSSSMDILDGELISKELIRAFGWSEQIESYVIAKQLEAIGLRWQEYSRKIEADTSPPSFKLPSWRFPLSEIQSMYDVLEYHRLSDGEGWQTSPVYRKLANALWIWTGKEFVYPCQIAVKSDAALEPLLYCCPSEHIIPRSLLTSIGIKTSFSTADYLEALIRLPRNVALTEKQVAACHKIYQILADDTASLEAALSSFVSQDMVLLDQSNCLVPSMQLVFDDMEWDESREVRRGTTFVSSKVPKSVAGLLGAMSLHSKLAQTSVTSRRVMCPSADILQSVLPSKSEWHHALLWETIFAAERLGGKQVDFFLDYRHHPSQRVIQPSLQALQDEALCIHIHDLVLSEHDIDNLYDKESPRAGLLCGFFVSDCMQILSGERYYILDPTGSYLSSSTGTTAVPASIGRQYEVLSQGFVRYPDQLLPFTTLPSCSSKVSHETRSTLIRFPWRKSETARPSYMLDADKADKLVTFIKAQLYQTLIFTESIHRISLWSVGKESEFASHCHGEVSLHAIERTLQKRNMTRKNQDWKKRFSLQSFFKSPMTSENQMKFVVNLELENKQYRDTWLFADNIGMGRSRDLACTPVHEILDSMPYVSVACHIFRDNSPPPRLRGRVYDIVCSHQHTGLPVHVNGSFKKTLKDKQFALTTIANSSGQKENSGSASGSELQIASEWNRILLEDGVSDAYAKLLVLAKRCYERSYPKALYNIWPTIHKRGRGTDFGMIVQTHVFHSVSTRELFLCSDGNFRALNNVYQLDLGGMNLQVSSFAQMHFPALKIPTQILQDCSRLLPSRLHALTPRVMRRFLRSVSSSEVHSDVCLSLLEYCLSDLPFPLPSETDPIWAEFHGLSLLPLEDESIGVLRVNQRRTSYIVASFNQIELLRPLRNLFISLATRQRLSKYFSDARFTSVFGIVSFSIKILSENIDRVLPLSWKNQDVVNWDRSSPIEIDELWLYRFWQCVHFDRRSLEYFASWPLIPTKDSRLVSCAKRDMAVCVWDGSADSEISALVAKAFQTSTTEHENKMADIEAECKRLIDLSLAKFKQDDEIAEDRSSDGEESGEDEAEREENDEDQNAEDGGKNSAHDIEIRSPIGDISDVIEDPSAERAQISSVGSYAGSEDTEESGLTISGPVFLNTNSGENNIHRSETVFGEDFTTSMYPIEDGALEFCSRETLHNVLMDLNVPMLELAYLGGQEHDVVPRSTDLAIVVLEGFLASLWKELGWKKLKETNAVLIAGLFAHYSETCGGFNRVQLEKLKQLPIYVNIRSVPCAMNGSNEYYLIPPDLDLTDIPLPSNAQQCFLKSHPSLTSFYKELGVNEMSDSKLLIYIFPMYSDLVETQREQVLNVLLHKWQSLRGNAELTAILKASALFKEDESEGTCYFPASAYCDPRNKMLATIYAGSRGHFPALRYQTPEWLDLMGEIGLQTEVTVDIFIECAQRIDGQCSGKQALTPEDEQFTTTLHEYFVQNFEKFDRSRSFFEQIATLSFVPAVVYEHVSRSMKGDGIVTLESEGQLTSRLVVRRYSDCAVPDDQALVFSTTPILANTAVPPRVLYSRLGIRSPPSQDQVVKHLLSITSISSRLLEWQFFLPMNVVFQAIFSYLQEHWDELGTETQQRLIHAAVIPVGSTLVKGSRLFFHLDENLAPLMFEVPRVFGAYDSLFRHMGSKEAPQVGDYISLLHDLKEESCGSPLNLNELVAAARAINLLVAAMDESNYQLMQKDKCNIFLPSTSAVMQSMLGMVFNDSASLCSKVDLMELHVVHPRISMRCCKKLGVPGITSIVTEELDGSDLLTEFVSDEIAHISSVLASQHFAHGLRKIITAQQQKASSYDTFEFIPDFEDLNQRIMDLSAYEVKCVAELHTRFVAKLEFPTRRIDVTKTSRRGSLSFLDQERQRIYILKRTQEEHFETQIRTSHLVARCVNQLLGGVLQDCSVLESIMTCDELAIPDVLQLLDIYEDPMLIVEKIRGVLGQPLCETDYANVELAPLRSCLSGELVAVEDERGRLCYGKTLRGEASDVEGVSRYLVRVDSLTTRWMLATQLYFFRSARVGTNGSSASLRTEREEYVELPQSVIAIKPEAQSTDKVSSRLVVAASEGVVPSSNILSAVNELLSRLNVTLDTNVEDLVAENARLQRRLELAEAGRRAAVSRIDSANRERKEMQDSLICAVCLENKVDRVLIPCGHIYCTSCIQQLPRPSCPICREGIISSSVFHVPS
ncbi:putative Zinc finger, RING-type, UBA-like superfamily, Zinc finger, RING/FYVE/PHD-type [Plasmopara halstedii]